MPVNFTVLLEFGFVNSDSHPFRKLFSFIEVYFNFVQFIERCFGYKV